MRLEDIVIMEDAGSLSQIPKAWWKSVTSPYANLGGQDSDIVQVGSDIFSGKTLDARAKAKRLVAAVITGAERHGNKIAGAFIKVDNEPFALILIDQTVNIREKYSAIFASGEKAATTETKSRMVGSGRNRRLRKFSYERDRLNLEELGYKLPGEGRVDVFIILIDPVRAQKRTERKAAKAGMEDKRLGGVLASAGKKFIKRKASATIERVKQTLTTNLNELTKNIDAVVAAVEGSEAKVDFSKIKSSIQRLSAVVPSLEFFIESLQKMAEGGIRSPYGKGKTYQYDAFIRSIESLENTLATQR